MDEQLNRSALDYHRYPIPGKITVMPTKGMTDQRDLALAYSPGVAVPCLAIQKDPLAAYDYTAKGNLVAVVSNGTAVLGLGNIGAFAGKPGMEGKGCLFKKFAGIDVFDIEIDLTDPDRMIEIVAALEPTFGGSNLEDIKAPECFTMQPVFAAAASEASKRIIYAEGEDERVLRAAQIVVDERLGRPTLVGRPEAIQGKFRDLGLRLEAGRDVEIASLDDEVTIAEAAEAYYQLRRRRGVTRAVAQAEARASATLIAALLLRQGKADGMLCGTFGSYAGHLKFVRELIGLKADTKTLAAMNLAMLPRQTVFICDTYINEDPSAEQLTEIALLAAAEVRRFGLTPRLALLSHSHFGSADTPSARKVRAAAELIAETAPDLEVEGEMHADAALSKTLLDRSFPGSRLTDAANLLVMPNIDAANITFNALKTVSGQGVTVGPILLGAAKPVHILTPTSTVRRLVNMRALTAVDAISRS
jgi:phosphotransacetylase